MHEEAIVPGGLMTIVYELASPGATNHIFDERGSSWPNQVEDNPPERVVADLAINRVA
jgi:hypothetical protein